MTTERIDPLAAMKDAGRILGNDFNHDDVSIRLLEARAAVAELVQAAKAVHAVSGTWGAYLDRRAALKRLHAALAAFGRQG